MKKIITLFFLIINIGFSLANPIDKETAKTVAKNFMDNKLSGKTNTIKNIFGEKYKGEIVYYVINFTGEGWVIVSADDNTVPILGYSIDNHSEKNVAKPSALNSLFLNYKQQIYKAKSKNKKINERWNDLKNPKRIESLVFNYIPGKILLNSPNRGEINWAQDNNNSGGCNPAYNEFCPEKDCDNGCYSRASAGCGAVALGQIMWYWQWPDNSSCRSYDWDLMPNELLSSSSDAEGDEIAHLLRDIGNKSNMTYWCAGSWAHTNKLVDALKNDFKYKGVEKKVRANWFDDVWNDLIRAEIDAGRPVLYRGGNVVDLNLPDEIGNVHYFVVDGYHQNNLDFFHVNWGWGGAWNGYFNFNDLTPQDDGTDEYNRQQRAITGISPTCTQAPYSINDVPYSTVTGFEHEQARNDINLPDEGKSLNVESNGKLMLTAGNSITLKSGFEAKMGSNFKATIETISSSQQGINVTAWTNYFPNSEDEELSFIVHNANTWEFQAYTLNGSLVYQSAGTIQGNEVKVWDGTGGSIGYYNCIIKFRNSCGELKSNSYLVYNGAGKSKKFASIDTTKTKNLKFTLKPK